MRTITLCEDYDVTYREESLFDTNSGTDDLSYRLEQEADMQDMYWEELLSNARKGMKREYTKSKLEERMAWIREALNYHAGIIKALDQIERHFQAEGRKVDGTLVKPRYYLSKGVYARAIKGKNYIFSLYKEKKISCYQMMNLVNWVNRLLADKYRFDVRYEENLKEELQQLETYGEYVKEEDEEYEVISTWYTRD